MRECSALLLLVAFVAVNSLLVSVDGEPVRVNHYPMTVADFAPYLPKEMLAEVQKMSPDQQRIWAWKQTDQMIASGLIHRQQGWEPWSESVAKVADDTVTGAGNVVRKVVTDSKTAAQNADELLDHPTVHNLAKTVASVADVPLNAKAGTAQVLKDNADRVLDKNHLGALKPIAHQAIDAGVNAAVPIPGYVAQASKIGHLVEDHTDGNHVLVCSIAAHQAAAGASRAPGGAKGFLQVASAVEHVVDADAEALWKAGVIPQHSCHYVPGKALQGRGLTLPPKPKPVVLTAAQKQKLAAAKTAAKGRKGPAGGPDLHTALQQHAKAAFKPKFVHPALKGLGVHAVPAAKHPQPVKHMAPKPKGQKAAKNKPLQPHPVAHPAHPAPPGKKPKKPKF